MNTDRDRSIAERLRLAWVLLGLTFGLMGGAIILATLSAAHGVGEFTPYDAIWGVSWLSFPAIGALIASRRPKNPVGWLADSFGLPIATLLFSGEYGRYAALVRPELAGDGFFIWLSEWPFYVSGAIAVYIFLLFPNGSLPSRKWRFVGFLAVLAAAIGAIAASIGPVTDESVEGLLQNPLYVPSLAAVSEQIQGLSGTTVFACAFASILSTFLRARRASREERKQLKWFYASLASMLFLFGTVFVLEEVLGIHQEALTTVIFALAVVAPPTGMAIAILRYRLYDIDVVINKTFVYFALAAFITLIYVGVVVGVGSLIGAGDEPNLGLSLLATGLVAVAFQPVRERTQRIANRIVYGQRLSPYEAVTSFSHRMAESLSFEEILPSVGQAAANAVGGERAKVKLLFPQGGSEEIFWPPTGTDHTQNSFDATVNVLHQGTQVGEIQVAKKKGEALSPQEHKLLSDLASQAGLAFSNLRLTEELKAKLVELQESRRRIVSAQDEERRRMERDIHDGAQQQLVSMSVKLGLAKSLLAKDPSKAQSMLEELKSEAAEAVETLRDLARGLYPPVLEEQGLVAALKSHIDKMGLNATVEAAELNGTRLDRLVEAAVYFVVREALQNASKHAPGADITVELHRQNGDLTFEVKDRGPGFDPTQAKIGSGLQNMRDRIEALDGTFEIKSSPGQGATLKGRVPSKTMEAVA